jgi:sulfite reductase (ferredoxin)
VAREALDALSVHINGCPNACGQQPVGAIGCSGVAQRVQDRLVPSYAVTVGGRCGATGARFGMPVGKVPAAALPAFVAELGTDFASRRAPGESFADYVDRVGTAYVQSLAARHAAIPGFSERPEFYRDWGAEEDFSLAGRGAGECGAGVFEVIQQDLAAAKQAIDPFGILIPAVRALLVTRGVDARDPDTVLREFERHFIDSGLVEEEARPLLNRARGYLQGWTAAFEGQEQAVTRLRDGVERLYATLDANLEFHPAARPSDRPAANFPLREGGAGDPRTETAAVMLDLSGVPCPMNFVKAKLKLETMRMGETLGIVLDDGEPIRNVPASLKGEGQDVESIAGRPDGRWLVTVRKRHG